MGHRRARGVARRSRRRRRGRSSARTRPGRTDHRMPRLATSTGRAAAIASNTTLSALPDSVALTRTWMSSKTSAICFTRDARLHGDRLRRERVGQVEQLGAVRTLGSSDRWSDDPQDDVDVFVASSGDPPNQAGIALHRGGAAERQETKRRSRIAPERRGDDGARIDRVPDRVDLRPVPRVRTRARGEDGVGDTLGRPEQPRVVRVDEPEHARHGGDLRHRCGEGEVHGTHVSEKPGRVAVASPRPRHERIGLPG